MRKPLLMLTAAASLAASALVSAGENYNYSHFTLGAAFTNTELDGLTVDETGWFVQGAYELESLPLVLEGGYGYSSVNDDELVTDASLDGLSYFVGSRFIISPTDRLDIPPGIAVGRTDVTASLDSSEAKADVTSYTASLDVRFHLERGLWLRDSNTHRRPFFEMPSGVDCGHHHSGLLNRSQLFFCLLC